MLCSAMLIRLLTNILVHCECSLSSAVLQKEEEENEE